MQDVEPHVEQLPHELEPLDAAVSPNKDASVTSITSISSKPLKISVIISPPLHFIYFAVSYLLYILRSLSFTIVCLYLSTYVNSLMP